MNDGHNRVNSRKRETSAFTPGTDLVKSTRRAERWAGLKVLCNGDFLISEARLLACVVRIFESIVMDHGPRLTSKRSPRTPNPERPCMIVRICTLQRS